MEGVNGFGRGVVAVAVMVGEKSAGEPRTQLRPKGRVSRGNMGNIVLCYTQEECGLFFLLLSRDLSPARAFKNF